MTQVPATATRRDEAPGLPRPATSFVGRSRETADLVRLLGQHRLVTVTGPGGVGKSRLAVEVARRAADQFPDGVRFVELGTAADEAQVLARVADACGAAGPEGQRTPGVIARAVASRRILLLLDNCEQVLSPAAELCGFLLAAAGELRILATSREQLWVRGEARYRLRPLELPGTGETGEATRSDAVDLFIERARQADGRFRLSPESAPLVSRVVGRLDGMPLAIEMAAARLKTLGIAGLAERVDDSIGLLGGRDTAATAGYRSLAEVADSSYRLLSPAEQRVFRWLSVFPGPFTLEAAEAVAGEESGASVLRLVDCSLLAPPRPGPDNRMRYAMLGTLRAYGTGRLTDCGEEPEACAALTRFALAAAEEAAAGMATEAGESGALSCLDAEADALGAALGWALEHDADAAGRLAVALAPWWRMRGRLAEAYEHLAAVLRLAPGQAGAGVQAALGEISAACGDLAGAADRCTAACAAAGMPSAAAADALSRRAVLRLELGDFPAAARDARLALAQARATGYRAGEAEALAAVSLTACFTEGTEQGLSWAWRAEAALEGDIPGHRARRCRSILAAVFSEAGEVGSARRLCAEGLERARELGDLTSLVSLLAESARAESLDGNPGGAAALLREAIAVACRIGAVPALAECVNQCLDPEAAPERWAAAVTLMAAVTASAKRRGLPAATAAGGRLLSLMRRTGQALPPAELREARERGAGMTVEGAAELVDALTAASPGPPPAGPGGRELSARERELVTLVAQGRTNAQIAAELFISIRTVSSHLDRIREKTGYRRRADLTRLALREGLV